MRPVFLLNMGVVVLLVGPAPRELNAPTAAVPAQMIINEFRAVIRINALQPERQRLPGSRRGRPARGTGPCRAPPAFDPGRVNVGDIQ